MDWTDLKILAHGKWDSRCIPPQLTLPANVALVFYCRHGQSVLGHHMRPIEAGEIRPQITRVLTRLGITVSNFASLKPALSQATLPHQIVDPGGTYYNYRLTHLGTVVDTGGLARHDPAAGSHVPSQIDGPFFMPAPGQRLQLEYVVRNFLQPHAPPGGVAVGHCLFCREI
jgi:hypothetical protein